MEVRQVKAWQKYVAEFFGTLILVFVGSLAILGSGGDSAARVTIAFGFGVALLAGLYAFGEVSGGHFNPAVSLGMFLSRRLDPRDLIAYWVAQIVGAVLASLAVLAASNQDTVASTATKVGAGSSAWDAFWLEFLLTAVFV